MANRRRLNKVSFFLARPASNTPTAVLARMRMGKEEVRFGTGISVAPKNWLRKSQRVKSSSLNAAPINDRLDRIATDLVQVVTGLLNQYIEPTPELVLSRYHGLLNSDATRAGDKTFFDFWEDWINDSKNNKSPQTLKLYESVSNQFKSYAEKRGAKLSFDRMDREFVNSFTDYMLTIREVKNPYVWHLLKTWKAFMQWANERGLTTNDYYRNVKKKDFNVHSPIVVRLTETEFKRLSEFDFSDTLYLDNARNLFVLQACLGVRVSDLLKIVKDPSHYFQKDSETIRIKAQKTGKEQLIPLSPLAKRILFSDTPPRHISDIKLNLYIKEAAKRAELNRTILKTEYIGKNRKDSTVPLHEEISTHCAKRTFVSLMVAKGVHIQVIGNITGNTLETIKRYINLDEQEIALEAKKAEAVFS